VRSSASSFSFRYPLFSFRSSSSCLRLLPCLTVTSILPSIFLSITCYRMQVLRKMWPTRKPSILLTLRTIGIKLADMWRDRTYCGLKITLFCFYMRAKYPDWRMGISLNFFVSSLFRSVLNFFMIRRPPIDILHTWHLMQRGSKGILFAVFVNCP